MNSRNLAIAGSSSPPDGKLFIVNRQNKGRSPRLLLGKLRQVTIAGCTDHLGPFALDGLGQRTNA